MSILQKRSSSPSPTITLDALTKQDLQRSSSEESIRVIHHAVLFPSSPNISRVSYIRRTFESDADIIRRQQVAIALQPLTFAEELAAKRKQLELRAEKRKLEKTAATEVKQKTNNLVPEITVVPASGKTSPLPAMLPAIKMKMRVPLKEKVKATMKPPPQVTANNRQLKAKQAAVAAAYLGQSNGNGKQGKGNVSDEIKYRNDVTTTLDQNHENVKSKSKYPSQ